MEFIFPTKDEIIEFFNARHGFFPVIDIAVAIVVPRVQRSTPMDEEWKHIRKLLHELKAEDYLLIQNEGGDIYHEKFSSTPDRIKKYYDANLDTIATDNTEIKKSILDFLRDSRFPQQKREYQTIKKHYPLLSDEELSGIFKEIGAIQYMRNDVELWGPPPLSMVAPAHLGQSQQEKVSWYKTPNIVVPSIIAVLIFVGGILYQIYSKDTPQVSISDVQYELQSTDGDVIRRGEWVESTLSGKDLRNIGRMLVSVKLRNPSEYQVFARMENYNEIFNNKYVVKNTGDFLDEMYSIPAKGESGFIFALDITPFTKVLLFATSTATQDIEFYNNEGGYIETAKINIVNVYGMSMPYSIGIYDKNRKQIDVLQFKVRCRAQMSELKGVISEENNRIDFSKSLAFECVPIF